VLLVQPDLLARFPQRGRAHVRIADVDGSAGKADLPGVRAELLASLGEEHVQSFGAGQQRNQDSGGAAEARTQHGLVTRERAPDLRKRYLLPLSHRTTTRAATARRYQANTAYVRRRK